MAENKLKEVIVVGSIVQDLTSYTSRFPNPGESVRGNDFKLGCGGKGANQCVQAARLGANVAMIGRVGNDMFGDSNIKGLKEAGVEVELIQKSDTAPTATALITVDGKGENTIVVTLGANLELSASRVHSLEERIARAGLLLCQFEIPEATNLAAFKIAREHRVTTFYNAAPGLPDMDKEILKFTDILCTNENETELILGKSLTSMEEFKQAAKDLLAFGPQTAVITLGPRGVIVANRSNLHVIPVPTVQAIDTTGAGDSFCGTLAHLMVKHPESSIAELSEKAAQVASMSVQKHGTQSSYPTLDEVKNAGIVL